MPMGNYIPNLSNIGTGGSKFYDVLDHIFGYGQQAVELLGDFGLLKDDDNFVRTNLAQPAGEAAGNKIIPYLIAGFVLIAIVIILFKKR